MHRWRWNRWHRLGAFLLTLLVVLSVALPALAGPRGFRSSSRAFRSFSSRSFSGGSRSLFGSPSRSTPGSFSSPAPRRSSPSTAPARPRTTSPSTASPATGSYSSPNRSFSSRDRTFSTGSRDYASRQSRSFSSPAPTRNLQPPGTTGTTTIAGKTYTTRADSYGRPVVIYDVGRSRYPRLPPVVVIGTPPFDPWYYHDLYWGMPWYLRMWYRPVYSYYGPGQYGFAYSLWAWVALVGGLSLATFLFMLWVRRRYFGV